MKVATVVGARPQFIKAATVSRALARRGDIHESIIHTGQHYDANMSDVFFDELAIPKPDYHLGIGGGSHGAMTGRQLESIEAVLLEEKPDWVLVYGDTNSTLAGALAAAKLNIPVAHVEAGLRSFNRSMPEEVNRIVADHVSTLLFAPTDTAMANLRHEGIEDHKLHLVGDVMYDAALFYRDRARRPSVIADLDIELGEFVLATIHRAENTDDREKLEGILAGFAASAQRIILPLHPRSRQKIALFGLSIPNNVIIIDPVGYLEMIWLEMNCSLVATDSGGVQKEAYFHGKPCVTLRDETEWVELVDSGWNVLAGSFKDTISSLLSKEWNIESKNNIFGDGESAKKIPDLILQYKN